LGETTFLFGSLHAKAQSRKEKPQTKKHQSSTPRVRSG